MVLRPSFGLARRDQGRCRGSCLHLVVVLRNLGPLVERLQRYGKAGISTQRLPALSERNESYHSRARGRSSMSSAQDVFPVASSARKSLRLILFPFLGAATTKARKAERQYRGQDHTIHEFSPVPRKAAATEAAAAAPLHSRILGDYSFSEFKSEDCISSRRTHTHSLSRVSLVIEYGKGSEER